MGNRQKPNDLTPNPNGKVGRLGPHSIEAEEAVLGAILINPNIIHEIADFLEADDFFEMKHRWIYQSFLDITKSGMDIDYLTVCERLKTQSDRDGDTRLSLVGGSSYITYLINNTPSHLNATTYAQLVETASARRRMLEAAGDIAQLAREENDELDDLIVKAEAKFGAAVRRKGDRRIYHTMDAVGEMFDNVSERVQNPDGAIGLPTGLTDLDRILGGLQRTEFSVIAGRPGAGKTAFLLGVAHTLMKLKYNVLIFSLEMNRESLMHRIMASETGIDGNKFRTGRMNQEEFERYAEATLRAREWGGFIEFTPGISIDQIKRRSAQIKREFGLDIIIVDYLQLAKGKGNENRTLEIGEITGGMKEMAGTLDVHVMTASQLNRALEGRQDKRPTLSDLRESGSTEQDADLVFGLYRDIMYNPDTSDPFSAEILILKNRFGQTGVVPARYVPQLTRFTDAGSKNGGRR